MQIIEINALCIYLQSNTRKQICAIRPVIPRHRAGPLPPDLPLLYEPEKIVMEAVLCWCNLNRPAQTMPNKHRRFWPGCVTAPRRRKYCRTMRAGATFCIVLDKQCHFLILFRFTSRRRDFSCNYGTHMQFLMHLLYAKKTPPERPPEKNTTWTTSKIRNSNGTQKLIGKWTFDAVPYKPETACILEKEWICMMSMHFCDF